MLPLIWILQNKETRTPIWQRNVCLTLFILHENWGFSHSDAGDSEGKNTSPLSPSSCLPRFSTIELSAVSKKPIKQLLIGQSVLPQASVQSEAKSETTDIRMNFYCHQNDNECESFMAYFVHLTITLYRTGMSITSHIFTHRRQKNKPCPDCSKFG